MYILNNFYVILLEPAMYLSGLKVKKIDGASSLKYLIVKMLRR